MYDILLFLHSWLRWAVLIIAILVIYKSFMGSKGGKSYTASDRKLAVSFVALMHTTALIGLVLYFFYSPMGVKAWNSVVSPMKIAGIRYWAVEHITMMILAVTVITIGSVKAKKQTGDLEKFKTQFIWFSIGLLLILSRIPWDQTARLFRF